MRVHPWILFTLSVMALTAGRTGYAQPGEMGGPGGGESPLYPESQFAPFGPAGPGGFVPPPPIAPAGAWDPIAAGQNGGPGYHPDRQPWPHISPFENRFAEHTHKRGLWFFQRDNSARRYFANVDYRYARYRRPDQTRVGFNVAPFPGPLPRFEGAPFPDFVPNTILLPQFPESAPYFDWLGIDTGTFYDSFVGNHLTVNTIAVNEQSLESEPTVNGINVEWGFRDPGGNGFQISGWYTPEAHWAYSRGFNPPLEDILSQENLDNGQPLVITHSLALNVGNDAINVPFDRFFGTTFETVSGGGDLNWLYTPFWKNDWYEFAPSVGLQFTYIGETFAFRAADSGFGGTLGVTRATTPTIPEGIEIGNGGVIIQTFPVLNPYEMQIYSEVDSYVFGPQIGLQYQFGGENLRIVGKSHVGLAANHERLELSGFGVGDPTNPVTYDPNARFREEQEHTRLSPTTSHEIIAEANIFSLIPVVNRIHFMEQAKFRIGYQINAAFEIQRPHRTIEYNGLPLVPAIRNDQETRWYVQSYNFGVHWDY